MKTDLKDTLNLPQTDFPMRANLVEREPKRIAHWEAMGLYNKIQAKNAGADTFVLHDGPPFTNGDIHIGTAFNKILKDITLRYKSMRGMRTPFVPGWDCHGLPIEHKVSRELQESKKTLDPVSLRKACKQFSESYIERQGAQFKRLGIMGEWDNDYRTMNPAYEADILRGFSKFVEANQVYRSKKPVYWSIPCRTALAEAEVEYQDHTSTALWVRFNAVDPADFGLTGHASIIIWTTTPWTLPANLALAVHPEHVYGALEHNGYHYIVGEKLIEDFSKRAKLEGATVVKTWTGRELEGKLMQHPFIERISPIVLADYVADDSGTGCVHTAPGHGLDDYHTGLRYGLEPYSPVDDDGCYKNDGKIPASLVGVSVLETKGRCPANEKVVQLLSRAGAIIHHERYQHSYPHCWRSKTPVIFRAMDQWFISLDENGLRKRVLESVSTVEWVPGWGENRIRGSIEARPDWCITRQRSWGVPMPVFYDEDKQAYLNASVIRAVADKIETYGTDYWFASTAEELLSGIELPESWKGKKLKPGLDTIDVWMDSGSSSLAVLQRQAQLQFPADLYLEGSDQHRGWFQSSLWIAVATTGKAPYKKVLTHGFIVDENYRKISKSGDKPQTAQSYVDRYGVDVLRLWASSENFQDDIPISETILNQVTQTYRTIRNTLRFQLGNLFDFDFDRDAVSFKALTSLDQWALAKTAELVAEATEAYDQMAYHRVYQLVNRFCNVVLSATYHDILKDRLYVSARQSAQRRSSQTAIALICDALLKIMAPVLTFTTDEAFAYSHQRVEYPQDASVHLQSWPHIDTASFQVQVVSQMEELLKFREKIHEALEPLRQQKKIGGSLDADVIICGAAESSLMNLMAKYLADLPELFIVSRVELQYVDKLEICEVKAQPARGVRCPRSWRWVDALVEVPGMPQWGQVSERSRDALLALAGEDSVQ